MSQHQVGGEEIHLYLCGIEHKHNLASRVLNCYILLDQPSREGFLQMAEWFASPE